MDEFSREAFDRVQALPLYSDDVRVVSDYLAEYGLAHLEGRMGFRVPVLRPGYYDGEGAPLEDDSVQMYLVCTPLAHAAYHQRTDVVDLLLPLSDPNTQVLRYTVFNTWPGAEDSAEYFLANAAEWERVPLLHLAAKQESTTLLERLLDDPRTQANALDSRGQTAIFGVPSSRAADLLITHGANPYLADSLGNTAAHAAVCYGALARIVDFDNRVARALNARGETPALVLAPKGREYSDMVRLLLANGADPDHESDAGFALAYFYIQRHDSDMLGLLLRSGASVEGSGAYSLLAFAAREGAHDCVMLLLDSGAALNREGEGTVEPIRAAVIGGDIEIVRQLYARGARSTRANRTETLLTFLAKRGGRARRLSELVALFEPELEILPNALGETPSDIRGL